MIQGLPSLRERFKSLMNRTKNQRSERVVTEILISIQGHAAPMVPIATSNLINSSYREVSRTINGVRGEVGYGAEYALPVHEASGKLKGQQVLRGSPKLSESTNPKRFGYVWDPAGEPGFLRKGAQIAIQQDVDGIIQRYYRL